jgi:hypothetical protein
VEVTTDTNTGKCLQNEYFGGQEEMGMKIEQMYLGDIISSDGTDTKNVQNRRRKKDWGKSMKLCKSCNPYSLEILL